MTSINKIRSYIIHLIRQNDELMWAKIWDDTKKGISWVEKMPGISPGRMAVGYNYLYIMTRVLNDLKPKSVLDLGLGISSTLISYYFNEMNMEGSYHTIVEHDKSWVEFYCNNNRISNFSEISLQDITYIDHKGYKYMAYSNLSQAIKGRKYSVISIDAPVGSDKEYSRRDILEYLPDILFDDFVIIIDDVDRVGEQNTVKAILNILKHNNIDCCTSVYHGETDVCVITSKNNKFICSL